MKKKLLSLLGGLAVVAAPAFAQRGLNPIPPADRHLAEIQAEELGKLIDPLARRAGESTVVIYNRAGLLCQGVAVGGEKLLAKWSDLIEKGDLFAASKDGKALPLKALGYYPDEDLILLEAPGLKAPAMPWGSGEKLSEGRILAAVSSSGQASAIGVVSVAARNLRRGDQGFLGIQMNVRDADSGVRVQGVSPGQAAEKAGIKPGDLIKQVGGDNISGFMELQTRIRRYAAGDTIEVIVQRGEKDLKFRPTLAGFDLDLGPENRRLQKMDLMSGEVSSVRDNFPNALQSDMEVSTAQTGAPVINLDGEVIGMVIARAGRVSTLILPGEEIVRLLKTEPKKLPQEGVARQKIVPEATPQ